MINDSEELLSELSQKDDKELRVILDKFYKEEQEISYKRRLLHAKIDILRAELTARLKEKREQGKSLITAKDLDKLTEILAKEVRGPDID